MELLATAKLMASEDIFLRLTTRGRQHPIWTASWNCREI